jgi:hypothetical protein
MIKAGEEICSMLHAWDMRNAYKILVRKPEGKRSLHGRPRCRWEDMKKCVREIGQKVWIGCIWLRMGTSDGAL